jgi:alpha-galactosidase
MVPRHSYSSTKGWHAPARDPTTGAPLADPVRFPNGIKAVADQVHALGLKYGIYSSAGTCVLRYCVHF